MNRPTCKAEMTPMITSWFCPACDEREAKAERPRDPLAELVELTEEYGGYDAPKPSRSIGTNLPLPFPPIGPAWLRAVFNDVYHKRLSWTATTESALGAAEVARAKQILLQGATYVRVVSRHYHYDLPCAHPGRCQSTVSAMPDGYVFLSSPQAYHVYDGEFLLRRPGHAHLIVVQP